MNAVHYEPTPERLEQMAEDRNVKETDRTILKKYWRGDVQLPAKIKGRGLAFLEMVGEFEIMWDRHLERVNVAKHRLDLLNEDVRMVHSALYRARSTMMKFAVANNGWMIIEKVIKSGTTEWAASIVFTPKTDVRQ